MNRNLPDTCILLARTSKNSGNDATPGKGQTSHRGSSGHIVFGAQITLS